LQQPTGTNHDKNESKTNPNPLIFYKMNNVAVASAATSPVTVSLNDWIKASSTKLHSDNSNQQSFVTNAVDLAWMLTRHLRRIVDHLIDETKLQEINAGNVIVFVDPPSSHNRLSVKDVKIILTRTVWGGGVHAEQYGKGTASRAAPPPPHAICAALGKILLYIFSWGQSSALSLPLSLEAAEVETISSSSDLLSNKNEANNYDNGPFSLEGSPLEINSSDAQNDYLEERIMKPPSAKRNATMPARRDGSAASKAANTLLLDVGMPLSICRLVGDLLNATTSNEMEPCCTLEEALWDLSYMKTSPNLYLFDRTCPQQALEDACLFRGNGRHLFGRKNEMRALFAAKNKISSHLTSSENNEPEHATTLVSSPRNLISPNDFLCKAVFLQGYAGAGKSSLIHSVVEACEEEKWFILECKFDKEKRMDISSAFNDFFGKCHETLENNPNSPLAQQFSKICCSISAAFDATGLHQLCNLIPNLKHAFPDSLRLSLPRGKGHGQRDVSSMDKVGSGDERRFHMLRLLLRSLCSVGRPVLLTLDDLQWARLFSVEFMGGFIEFMHASSGSTGRYSRQGGLLIVGAYRSNEVEADGDLLKRINSMKQSDKENVVTLNVGEMTKIEINKLISSKLCLPMRYTKNLSDLAHAKTGGNAFFIIEFLWSIIQNKCLQFSVRSRRWEWDVETISMSTISDGVAELLLESFSQLPSRVKQLIKIISCLGYQVEEWLIDALDYNNQILSFNMKNELVIAVQENFLEKAGPVWQFTHDIVKSTIYELIPAKNRALLHKNIGDILLTNSQHFPSESKAIQKMATDQINKYCQCGHLDKHNRSLFASQNVMAAKSALTSYNFEEAQSYIDSAIKLLEIDHWETQYSLSLELFEMSASISCMHGDIDKMSSCLDNILSHAKEFNDTLKASSLLVKLLAASTKFEEAISNCLVILENLGEHFANDVSPSEAARELSVVTETLLNNNVTCEQFKLLPLMTDKRKINAMKFMNMACQYSLVSRPMLLPLLCCRMLRLTIKYGFCDDSIVGLATVGYSSFTLTENTRLGSQIGKTLLVHRLLQNNAKPTLCCSPIWAQQKCARL